MTLITWLRKPIAIVVMAPVLLAALPMAGYAQDIVGAEQRSLNQQAKPQRWPDRAPGSKNDHSNITNPTNDRLNDRQETEAPSDSNTGKKVGATRRLPSLQTRAKPPLAPDTLHMGMVQSQFFKYAQDNNWLALETAVGEEAIFYQWLPGGEGIYALPEKELIYARGFIANVYFQDDRLVGMRLMPDRREQILNAAQLITLARAWFPDDVLSILYQVTPDDPNQLVTDSLIGAVPDDFQADFGNQKLLFCRVLLFPAPIPVEAALSNCSTAIPVSNSS
jgi:hypothetical protein